MRWITRRRGGTACPGCGSHVFPDKTFISGATFNAPVHFAGDGTVSHSTIDFSKATSAEVKASGSMLITNCHITSSPTGILLGGGSAIGSSSFPLGAPKKSPDLELTFATEPIVAWRTWNLVDFEFRGGATEKRLAPYSAALPWEPMRRMEAVCTASGHHEAPWQTCTCGIWAVRESDEVPPDGSVNGTVYLWGRVLEFERGYRAQFAYPKELVAPDVESAADLARIYGIPVTSAVAA